MPVKQAMIDWLGPIIHEYYGATEGLGFTMCDSQQWLSHKGTIGKALFGEPHVLDEQMNEVPAGTIGKLWFKTASPFSYFNDARKTAEANSPDGTMSTVGDIGYIDDEGFIYLTDRASFMIISGGVNIYPQECENLLVTHPKVLDAAVFGVPNEDLGEEVKAVVELMHGVIPSGEHRGRVDRLLSRTPSSHEMPALGRFRGRVSSSPDRQALQDRAPGSILEEPPRLEFFSVPGFGATAGQSALLTASVLTAAAHDRRHTGRPDNSRRSTWRR